MADRSVNARSIPSFFSRELLFLDAVFALAFIIRYIGLKFGYPLLTHPDEHTIMEQVYELTLNRTLSPVNYNKPDQILYFTHLVYLNLISYLRFGASLASTFTDNRFFFYYSGRVLIALLGSLIPIVTYKIGKQSPVDFSVPAALLFALFPVFVIHSHYVTPDIPITLFTLLVILFAVSYLNQGDRKFLLLATLFAAINTAEKYPGLLSFGIVLLALLVKQVQEHRGKPRLILKNLLVDGLKYLALYLVFFTILAPNVLIQYPQVLEALKRESRSSHLGADGLGWLGNMGFYVTNFFSYTNVMMALFGLAGVVGAVKTRAVQLLPCCYGLVYWVAMSRLALHWERWALPAYTFPLLLAAFGVGYLWRELRGRRALQVALATLFGLSSIWSLLFALSKSIEMTYTPTQYVAQKYCKKVGITRENSAYEGYTPFMPEVPKVFEPGEIHAGTQYILLSSGMYGRYYADPGRDPALIETYERIRRDFLLKRSFGQTPPATDSRLLNWLDDTLYYVQRMLGKNLPERYTGPTIDIYVVK